MRPKSVVPGGMVERRLMTLLGHFVGSISRPEYMPSLGFPSSDLDHRT